MSFRKIAVLGAGAMGAQIALHLGNAGIPSVLLDVSRDAARQGLERARRLKPDPQFTPELVDAGHDRQLRRRPAAAGRRRLGDRSGGRTARRQARADRARRRRLPPRRRPDHQHLGHPGRDDRRGLAGRTARALAGHPLLQPAPLPAAARGDPDRRHRPGACRRGVRLRRSGARQGRGRRQGHAELHRQSPGAARRRGDAARGGVGPLHHRRGRCDHRAGDWPAGFGDVPHHGHRRPRRPRPRAAEPRRSAAVRRGSGVVPHPGAADPSAGGWRAGREGRPRLLRAPQGRRRARRRSSPSIRPVASTSRSASPPFPSIEAGRGIDDAGARVRTLFLGKDRVGEFLRETLAPTLVYAARVAPDIAAFDRRRRSGDALGLRLGAGAVRARRRDRHPRGARRRAARRPQRRRCSPTPSPPAATGSAKAGCRRPARRSRCCARPRRRVGSLRPTRAPASSTWATACCASSSIPR